MPSVDSAGKKAWNLTEYFFDLQRERDKIVISRKQERNSSYNILSIYFYRQDNKKYEPSSFILFLRGKVPGDGKGVGPNGR